MLEEEFTNVVGKIAKVFARRKVRHAVIGGVAVGLRSRPRATKDIDLIVQVPALSFPGLLEELVEVGFQIDVHEAVRHWSTDRFIAFMHGRVRVDWMQPVLPLYANVISTAEPKPWLDTSLNIATPEGLILTKMAAFRTQDQADIETLLAANKDTIDLNLIRQEWSAVSVGEEARTKWLEDAFARLAPAREGTSGC